MYRLILILLLIAVLAVSGCSSQEVSFMAKPEDAILQSYDPGIAEAQNQFGFAIYRALPDKMKNTLISPLSLTMAFGMALSGTDGSSEVELAQLMGVGNWSRDKINSSVLTLLYLLHTADPEVVLETANSAWMKEDVPFVESYQQELIKYYLAHTETLDFSDPQVADVINKWVDENTRGLIPEIVEPPVDPLSILFLINSTYFKGTWTAQFDPKQTREKDFFLLDGNEVRVPMMSLVDEFPYYEDQQVQIIQLPYGENERISMSVVLPKDNMQWEEFLDGWNETRWQQWQEQLEVRKGNVLLPRFDFSYSASLVDTMKGLGLESVFDPDQADFSRMVPRDVHDDVHITEIIHKARIIVNEEGTEAAAATSIEIGLTSVQEDVFEIEMDHPFLFLIQDHETGAVLFLGHVTNPS